MRVRLRYALFAGALVSLPAILASNGSAAGTVQRTYRTGSTRPLRTALYDMVHLNGPSARAFALTRSAGAQDVRLAVRWSVVAPSTPPAGFDPSYPNSPGYSWNAVDATVDAAESAGLVPILDITSTPTWAYAKRRSGVNAGTPKTSALGQFALALATHYDGTGGGPAVKTFEVWNEPNLSLDLAPVKASAYRAMVNAVATSVHAVDSDDVVVAGGLDPFGHASRRDRIHMRRATTLSTSTSGPTIRTPTAAR